MGLGIRVKLIDSFDFIHQKLCNLNLPPYSLRARVGLVEDYESIPQEYIAYFRFLCDLKMDQRILDIGCGPGKFATQLLKVPHMFRGEYCGFDIHRKSIEWARKYIAQLHPNCRFEYVDLYNSHYNPGGKLQPESFSFSYEEDQFDFIFAISVFTHLVPEVSQHYLKEIERVLKKGGKALLTFLLLDGQPEMLSQTSQQTLKFFLTVLKASGKWYHHDNYSIISKERPEAILAYQKSALKQMVDVAGLKLDKIHYGVWNETKNFLSFQDIVIVQK